MKPAKHTRHPAPQIVLASAGPTSSLPAAAPKRPPSRHRFALLLTGHLMSCSATWIYRLTFPLLILNLTGSALNAAVLYALEYIPFLLLSLPCGALVDRCNRRRLLIVCDVSVAVVATGIGVAVLGGFSHLLTLYVAAFLMACAEPLYHPAFQALLPTVVDDAHLDSANSWVHGGENVITLAAPVAAGGLIVAFGYGIPMFICAGGFLIGALTILAIRGTREGESGEPAPAKLFAEIVTAVVYITRRNRTLLAGSLLFTATNFCIWLVQANLMYYLTFYHGFTAAQVGFFLTLQGLGALIGAAIAPYLIRRASPTLIISRSTIAGGLVTLALLLTHNLVSISLIFALLTALSSLNIIAWFTLRQRIVPLALLGRVVALTRMIAVAAIPVAALIAGTTEEIFHNIYLLFAAAGLLRVAVGILAWRSLLGSRVEPPPSPEDD